MWEYIEANGKGGLDASCLEQLATSLLANNDHLKAVFANDLDEAASIYEVESLETVEANTACKRSCVPLPIRQQAAPVCHRTECEEGGPVGGSEKRIYMMACVWLEDRLLYLSHVGHLGTR